ncbi:hypothetical protein FA218_26840, partial [Pseudomonas aeruginosa]|nr:hypothetical protein [Pseudomonas aeruginosa]
IRRQRQMCIRDSYEVYRDDAAYEAHTRTAHFRDSRPLVEPLILEQEVFESDALALNPLR